MNDKAGIRGKIVATVLTPEGEVKRYPQTWWERMLGIAGKPMVSINHNIVTNDGDALIADLMCNTPAKQKFNTANSFIQVGTGYTAATKTSTTCLVAAAAVQSMDPAYPKIKGAYGAANDNVVQYRSLFAAGCLSTDGLDEVCLINASNTATGSVMAYAQITPVINIATVDTLQLDWELTVTGA